MKKIRIAQIGTAHPHALGTALAIEDLDSIFDFVAVCEEDEAERKKALKLDVYKNTGFKTKEEILNDSTIDAVAIETRELDSVKNAILFAKKGFHIYLDKPGGESLSEFEKLVKIVKENKLIFTVGYMYRYNKGIGIAKRTVNEGEIGDIISIDAQMSAELSGRELDNLISFKGGMMFFLGCHLVDVIYGFLGEPKNIVTYIKETGNGKKNCRDFGYCVFEYENGVSTIRTNATEIGGYDRRQITIYGTKGTMVINPVEKWIDEKSLYSEFYALTVNDKGKRMEKTIKSEPYERYFAMFFNFAKDIAEKNYSEEKIDTELNVYKLVLKASGIN